MPPVHSFTIIGQGPENRARRVTPAGRPADRIDADGPETTPTLTGPLRSPALTGPRLLVDRRGAGRDSTGVHPQRHERGDWTPSAADPPSRGARTSALRASGPRGAPAEVTAADRDRPQSLPTEAPGPARSDSGFGRTGLLKEPDSPVSPTAEVHERTVIRGSHLKSRAATARASPGCRSISWVVGLTSRGHSGWCFQVVGAVALGHQTGRARRSGRRKATAPPPHGRPVHRPPRRPRGAWHTAGPPRRRSAIAAGAGR
jgi:hypothetical protein